MSRRGHHRVLAIGHRHLLDIAYRAIPGSTLDCIRTLSGSRRPSAIESVEVGLGDTAVHAFDSVDNLGDLEVRRCR